MGQLVAVVEKPSAVRGVRRFEANRVLTGQGHETFHSVAEASGSRPAAVVARLLLETGQVDSVHVYSNVITVHVARGHTAEGLDAVVRDMYQYWKPGMVPQAFEAPADEPAAASAGGGGDTGGATGPEAEYLRLVPAVLVERSRAAMARWKAKQG